MKCGKISVLKSVIYNMDLMKFSLVLKLILNTFQFKESMVCGLDHSSSQLFNHYTVHVW